MKNLACGYTVVSERVRLLPSLRSIKITKGTTVRAKDKFSDESQRIFPLKGSKELMETRKEQSTRE